MNKYIYIIVIMIGAVFLASEASAASITPAKSGLAPPKTKSIYFPSQTSNSAPVINITGGTTPTGLSSPIAPCPNDPSTVIPNPTTTTIISTYKTASDYSPYPTDIQGNPYTTTAPAEQCTVTSRVYYTQPNGTIADGVADISKVTNNIYASITAVCPDGYAQVGSYNMQPEVVYRPAEISVSPTTLLQLNNYVKAGYTCDNDGTQRNLTSRCHWSNGSIQTTFTFDQPINKLIEVVAGGTVYVSGGSDNPTLTSYPKAGVVKFSSIVAPGWGNSTYASQCHWFTDDSSKCNGNSPTTLAYCVPNCTMSYAGTTSTATCSYSVEYAQRVLYLYQYQICKLPAGFSNTGNTIPATLICVRIQSKYNKMYK